MSRLFLPALAMLLALPLTAGAAPRVTSDLPPVASLAAQVMGDHGRVAVLIATGGDGHHHQLRPSEARLVADADLLIWLGPAMTPWLMDAAQALAPGARLTLLDLPGLHLHAGHDHGADGDAHAIDPHAWLDPENGRIWLDAMAGALAEIDPAQADAYRSNAQAGKALIDAAEAEARAILADLPARPIVIAHDSLGYFTEAMGLPPALAITDHSDGAPSARALRQLRASITANDARCFHPEGGGKPQIPASLDGLGLREGAPIDAMGAGRVDAAAYPAILVGIAKAIADCARAD